MIRRRFPTFLTVASALLALTWGSGQAYADKDKDNKVKDKGKKASGRKEGSGKAPLCPRYEARCRRMEGFRHEFIEVDEGDSERREPAHPESWRSTGYTYPPLCRRGRRAPLLRTLGNWAYSPLPRGPVAKVTPTNPGSGTRILW